MRVEITFFAGDENTEKETIICNAVWHNVEYVKVIDRKTIGIIKQFIGIDRDLENYFRLIHETDEKSPIAYALVDARIITGGLTPYKSRESTT